MSIMVIAHRANLTGPGSAEFGESHRDSIELALLKGHLVEADLWFVDGYFYLGHDGAEYRCDNELLGRKGVWWHCKNIPAFERMLLRPDKPICFFHQEDQCTLTSNGFIWTYPGEKALGPLSITVSPDPGTFDFKQNIAGICTDFPGAFL